MIKLHQVLVISVFLENYRSPENKCKKVAPSFGKRRGQRKSVFIYERTADFDRDAGAGRGGHGGTLPPQLGSCGDAAPPPPPPPTLDCRSCLFLFVFARELGSLTKK